MHVPQSVAAASELKYLASVLRQIISPRLASPIIQNLQDTMTGSFRISQIRSRSRTHCDEHYEPNEEAELQVSFAKIVH